MVPAKLDMQWHCHKCLAMFAVKIFELTTPNMRSTTQRNPSKAWHAMALSSMHGNAWHEYFLVQSHQTCGQRPRIVQAGLDTQRHCHKCMAMLGVNICWHNHTKHTVNDPAWSQRGLTHNDIVIAWRCLAWLFVDIITPCMRSTTWHGPSKAWHTTTLS